MQEIERIEAFYLKQIEEYRNEFETLDKRYMQKVEGLYDQPEKNSMSIINERSEQSFHVS
jgi:inorganic pyrophosphatase